MLKVTAPVAKPELTPKAKKDEFRKSLSEIKSSQSKSVVELQAQVAKLCTIVETLL